NPFSSRVGTAGERDNQHRSGDHALGFGGSPSPLGDLVLRSFLSNSITMDHSMANRQRASSAAQSPTLQTGLYVSDIRFGFADLDERHGEISMRVFNGTGRVVEFSSLYGHIRFTSPNSTDPLHMGELPTPSTRADMAQAVGPFKEWLVILSQRVPATEADKLLAMLAADIPIHFDLSGLTIEVCARDGRQKAERLPIWGGLSYNRGSGFGQIIQLTASSIL